MNMNLCEYKNALGTPDKGIHSYRLFGVAIADVIMTLVGSLILSYLLNIKFIYVAIFAFILGIILHRLFCVRTTVDVLLFPNTP